MKKTSVAVALTVLVLVVAGCGKGDDVGVLEGRGSLVEGSSVVDGSAAGGDVAPAEVTKADGVGESVKRAVSVVEDAELEVGAGVEEAGVASSSEDAVAVRAEASMPEYVAGLVTLEEHVLTSDVVARVRLRSIEATARPSDTLYLPYVVITFDVLEALQGSPGGTVVVELLAGELCCHEEEAAALEAGRQFIAGRDTSWDANEAVVFLWEIARSTYTIEEGRPGSVGYVFADNGYAGWTEDHYSVFSESSRAWLPAMAASGDGAQSFYVDDPAAGETITLADVKTRMVTANAMVDSSIEGHRECVLAKVLEQRDGHPKLPEFLGEESVEVASGDVANKVIYRYETGTGGEWGGTFSKYVVDGPDGRWFTGEIVDDDADPRTNYSVVFKQVRPLAGGEYVFHHGIQVPVFFPCDYVPTSRVKYTVTVTAPEGTRHELLFDPVTIGSAVGADGTNGLLEPGSFTDWLGQAARIEGIKWESGSVTVKVSGGTNLSGDVMDFIGADGEVSLSLNANRSSYSSRTGEFVWGVGTQPWQHGDKLIVRLRRAPAFAGYSHGLEATVLGGDSVKLSWRARDGVTGHRVEYREAGSEGWQTADAAVTEETYTVEGLTCSTDYEFRVGSYGDGSIYRKEIGAGGYSTVSARTSDVCNQPPAFDAESYSFEVSEDVAVGVEVGTVSATDPDQGDMLAYSVVSGNEAGKFALDGGTGSITVAAGLDYDASSSYSLVVEVADGNGGTDRATVAIGVTEVIDTSGPVFGAAEYSFSVVESASVGSTVGAVSATDPNEGDTVAYSISAGNEAGKFSMESDMGRITLAGTLDYETSSSYTLTVEASDGKGGKGTATVTVSVEQASCSNGTAVASPSDNAGLVKDWLTLLALRDSLEGTVVLNWRSDIAIGNWKGVGVAGTPRRVQSLSLSDLDLDGTVPAGLGDLAHLRRLDLSENELTGGVPTSLGKLSGLELLELSENDLTGAIPSDLGGLTSLGRLSLGQNGLTGSIPPSLGRLSYLYSLSVDDNDLSGSIPGSLGSLSRLLYLSLGGNDLSGMVPSELGSLASLQYLYLDTNDLTGRIPSELGSLSKLEILSLYGNKLSGEIPSSLGNLSKLEELMLSRNGLTGSIPSSLERLSKLVYLRLSGNRLTGCIPAGLRNVADNDLGRLGLAYCAAEA